MFCCLSVTLNNTLPSLLFVVSYWPLFITALDSMKSLATSVFFFIQHPPIFQDDIPSITLISWTYSFSMTSPTSATHSHRHTLELLQLWKYFFRHQTLNIAYSQSTMLCAHWDLQLIDSSVFYPSLRSCFHSFLSDWDSLTFHFLLFLSSALNFLTLLAWPSTKAGWTSLLPLSKSPGDWLEKISQPNEH